MKANENYEQEIDLKDLMFAVLRKWRLIILVAVLFAALLGGVKALKGFGQLKDADYIEENQKAYNRELEEYNLTKERLEKEIANLTENIKAQEEYADASVLMNTNPYDVYKEKVTFYISTDYMIMPGMAYQNPNTATSILKGYMTIAQNGEMYNYVLDELDDELSMRYLKELVTITPDYNNSMLDITVVGDTKERAAEIMTYIKACAEDSRLVLTEAIGEHDITVVDESSFVSVDLDLEKKQKEFADNVTALGDSLDAKNKELEEMVEPKNTLITSGSVVKSAVKYAVLGGVLGAFMIVFFVCVAFLMSDKLVSEKELRRRYNLMVLGVSRRAGKKSRNIVDVWLARLDGSADRELEETQLYEVAAANALNYMDGVKEILLVGTVDGTSLENLKSGLSSLLGDAHLAVGGNLSKDAQAIKKIAACDGVIVVEQRGVSLFGDIEQELNVVYSLDKKVLGCIVL